MKYARSGKPPQTYFDHVFHVLVRGLGYLKKMRRYARGLNVPAWTRIFELAAEYHDLGKLEADNQRVLEEANTHKPLPVQHTDAGVAAVAREFGDAAWFAQLFINAHHIGLPDFSKIENEGLRDKKIETDTDNKLTCLLELHEHEVRHAICRKTAPLPFSQPIIPQDIRAIFSCLVNADQGDAARARADGDAPKPLRLPKLRAAERLVMLRNYTAGLAASADDDERNRLRAEYFAACADAVPEASIVYSDSPVGTGKTTALMVQLLRSAAEHGLRRIFVILPFTNIITQSVQVYRKALVLPGEDPEQVVAEIHHRADFENRDSRELTALWDAPIVVTTAVAFFETLASAKPSTLRRLQNLPGSAIFLDEAHAMLPVKLLPLAWRWIHHAATEWSCRWVLASGSLCKFWELEEFRQDLSVSVPNLVPQVTVSELGKFELQRVTYRHRDELLTVSGVAEWLKTLPGPIIAVFNTVHTTAAVAQAAAAVFGKDNVLHISTALTPTDRDRVIEKVRRRLRDIQDTRWCLIATSCVEAGVDFSFRTGVRECASLLSLLQLAGRVNRNAEHADAEVWSLRLNPIAPHVRPHPVFETSAGILWRLFEQGTPISPALCTDKFKEELLLAAPELKKLAEMESHYAFNEVEKNFRVIQDESVPVLVDLRLIAKVRDYEDISWLELQRGSVRLRANLCRRFACEEAVRYPGLWLWPDGRDYDDFLGYMAEVLKVDDLDRTGSVFA